MNYIVLAILIVTIIFYYLKYNCNLLNPKILQLIPWFISIFVFSVFMDKFDEVSNFTFAIILLGIIFFQMGCFLGEFEFKHENGKKLYEVDISINKMLINITVFISIGIIILMTLKAIKIANITNIGNFYTSLRIGISIYGGYGKLGYFVPLCYAILNFIIIIYVTQPQHRNKIKYQTIIIIMMSIWLSILTTGRGFVLQLLTIIFCSVYLYNQNKRKLNKYLMILVIIFLIIFIIYTLILRSENISGMSLEETINYLINSISVYISGSLPAFNCFISNNIELDYGLNTFRTINSMLNSLGYDFQVVNLVKEFTTGKQITNIYTVYEPYIRDFGVLGAFLFQFIFGFIHGNLYKKSQKNMMYMYFYVISIFPLLMQPLLDQYFSLLSNWIQYYIWGILLFKSNIFIKYINKKL